MKRVMLSSFLVLSLVAAVAFSNRMRSAKAEGKVSAKPATALITKSKKPLMDFGPFYWFDPSGAWIGNTLDEYRDQMEFTTGWDHYTYNPKTLQLRGYYKYNCSLDEYGTPHPYVPWVDCILYSHP